jgi:outer membrane receptor protein involved in Fe transport
VEDKGIELGVDAAITRSINTFANYSHQWKPKAVGFPLSEINLPPRHRFNAGFDFTYRRALGNLSVNYTDEAFWQDVLDVRFHGTTEAYTIVNTTFGVRWADGKTVTSVKVTNLLNKELMQHIFGDVLKRHIVGEVRVAF